MTILRVELITEIQSGSNITEEQIVALGASMIDFVKNTIVPLQQEKLTNIIPGAKAYPAQVKVRSYEEDEVEE